MATTEATEAEYRAQFEEIRQGTDRWPPLHDLMGIEMVRVTPTTILSMVLSDQVRGQVPGTVHGGILATFADVASAIALWNSYDMNTEAPVTTDLHVRYYRQPKAGPLTADASVIHKGRHLLGTECVVTDAEERVLARTTATYMVVPFEG